MKIQVEIKNNYGKEVCYPVCEKAKMFARISGNTTLTKGVIKSICDLGFAVEVVKIGSFGTQILYSMPRDSQFLD